MRSAKVELFEPLFKIPKMDAVSLQYDITQEEANYLQAHGVRCPRLTTWQDTLRELEQCEKVISVDTCMVHLAGSIGIPTWVLIPFSPDWRWLLDRTDSPWYPSVRLFRQTTDTLDWAETIERVLRVLRSEWERI